MQPCAPALLLRLCGTAGAAAASVGRNAGRACKQPPRCNAAALPFSCSGRHDTAHDAVRVRSEHRGQSLLLLLQAVRLRQPCCRLTRGRRATACPTVRHPVPLLVLVLVLLLLGPRTIGGMQGGLGFAGGNKVPPALASAAGGSCRSALLVSLRGRGSMPNRGRLRCMRDCRLEAVPATSQVFAASTTTERTKHQA